MEGNETVILLLFLLSQNNWVLYANFPSISVFQRIISEAQQEYTFTIVISHIQYT